MPRLPRGTGTAEAASGIAVGLGRLKAAVAAFKEGEIGEGVTDLVDVALVATTSLKVKGWGVAKAESKRALAAEDKAKLDADANVVDGEGQGQKLTDAKKAELEKNIKKNDIENPSTKILDTALMACAAVDVLDGVGQATEGEEFNTAAQTYPDPDTAPTAPVQQDWQGDAATAYAGQDKALAALTKQMAVLDQKIYDVLGAQAEKIEDLHLTNTEVMTALIAAKPLAIYIWVTPWLGGPTASKAFQGVVASLASADSARGMLKTQNQATENADQLADLEKQYDALEKEANKLERKPLPTPTPTPTPEPEPEPESEPDPKKRRDPDSDPEQVAI